MDLAWRDLTRWLAARAAPFVPDAPECLPRDGYGWAGHIAQSPTLREVSPALHHRRAGGLLAILHWLRATDVHDENVIAGAAGPVPVDLETLLRPTLASDVTLPFGDPATAAAVDTIANSVLATHYLRAANRRAGADAAAPAGFRHVNTDAMIRVRTPAPRLTAGTSTLAEHRDDFVAGFAETYGFLAHHRDALSARPEVHSPASAMRVRASCCETRPPTSCLRGGQRSPATCGTVSIGACRSSCWSVPMRVVPGRTGTTSHGRAPRPRAWRHPAVHRRGRRDMDRNVQRRAYRVRPRRGAHR